MVVGVLLGRYLFRMANLWQAMAAALTQAALFFLVTNFGVWLGGGMGSRSGLLACYVAAIPFFHYQLLGAVTYTGLFWFLYYRAFPALAGKSLSPRQS